MYRMTRIRLHNICQHSDLDVNVEAGLTGILAPNGTGKTNMCRGVVYALTGLVDGLWGGQQTLQKDGTADIGWAQVDFTDGQHSYAIRRFSTSSAKFPDVVTKDGKELHKRRKQVDDFMSDVFGMPCALMFQVCWGRQGELAQLLMSTPALVSDFLSKVFDMKQIEIIRDRLKSVQGSIVVPSSGCVEQIKQDEETLASIPDPMGLKRAAEEKERALAITREREKELSVKMATGTKKEDIDLMMDRLNYELGEVRIAISRGEEIAMGYSTDRTEKEALKDYLALNDEISKVKDELRTLNASVTAETNILERIDSDEKSAEQERALVQRNCIDHDRNECPVCGSEVQDWSVIANAAIKKMLGRFNTVGEYLADYDRQKVSRKQLKSSSQTRIDGLKKQIAEVGAKLEELNRQKALRDRENGFFTAQANRQKEAEILARIEELKTLPVIDSALVRELDNVKMQERIWEDELVHLRADMQTFEVQRKMLEEYIKNGKASIQKYETAVNVQSALELIRDALSQSHAQARYIKARVDMLNRALARYMRYTELPFDVKLDTEDRLFVYRTADGYIHPAAHLSGAQRAMVAVALQMALYDMMKPNMCLYIIDEPTEPLDNNNKEIMAGMFDRMNRMIAAAGGTMLIVTRDQPLIDCCTNVLELKNE